MTHATRLGVPLRLYSPPVVPAVNAPPRRLPHFTPHKGKRLRAPAAESERVLLSWWNGGLPNGTSSPLTPWKNNYQLILDFRARSGRSDEETRLSTPTFFISAAYYDSQERKHRAAQVRRLRPHLRVRPFRVFRLQIQVRRSARDTP